MDRGTERRRPKATGTYQNFENVRLDGGSMSVAGRDHSTQHYHPGSAHNQFPNAQNVNAGLGHGTPHYGSTFGPQVPSPPPPPPNGSYFPFMAGGTHPPNGYQTFGQSPNPPKMHPQYPHPHYGSPFPNTPSSFGDPISANSSLQPEPLGTPLARTQGDGVASPDKPRGFFDVFLSFFGLKRTRRRNKPY